MTHYRIIPLLLVIVVATLSGCSQDIHSFYSSVHFPTNITLVNTVTDEPVWFKEIPIGQTLTLDFDREGEDEGNRVEGKPATQVQWKLFNDHKSNPIDSDTLDLQGQPIIIKVSYRSTSE